METVNKFIGSYLKELCRWFKELFIRIWYGKWDYEITFGENFFEIGEILRNVEGKVIVIHKEKFETCWNYKLRKL